MKVGLKLDNVQVLGSRLVVPTGNYSVRISEAEIKETAKKNGHYLKLTYVIESGEHKGQALSSNDIININNPNEDATRIGLSTIKTIMTVGGHKNPNMLNDTDELLGLRFNVFVEEEPHSFENDKGETIETTRNQYRAYYEYEEAQVSSPVSKPKSAKKASKPAPAPAPESAEPEAVKAPAPQASESATAFPWMK